jgi:uncharacterized protein
MLPGEKMLCAYNAPFAEFRQHCLDRSISFRVESGFSSHFGYTPSPSEAASWAASLTAVVEALGDRACETYVFVELQMPLSSARWDMLIVGRNQAGHATALVVELKQWSRVSESAIRDTVSMMGRPTVHPSVQARSYVNYLKHFHGGFTGPSALMPRGCAFLPNIRSTRDITILTSPGTFGTTPKEYPVFTGSSAIEFALYAEQAVGHGTVDDAESMILSAEVRPSIKILDVVAAAVQGTQEWQLLDEQITAYNQVISLVEDAREIGSSRHLVVVRGGPGTGKSVLAIQLLGYGARHHWRVAHATGSKAFQTVLQAKTESFADAFFRKIHNVRFKKDLPVDGSGATGRPSRLRWAKNRRQAKRTQIPRPPPRMVRLWPSRFQVSSLCGLCGKLVRAKPL